MNPTGIFTALLAAVCGNASAAIVTYTADASTLHLYHLDEIAGGSVAANSGSAGGSVVSYNGSAFSGDGVNQPTVTDVLGGAGYTGFGNAAVLTTAGRGLGYDLNNNGAFMMGDGAPAGEDQMASHTSFFSSANSAFTLEAMVNLSALTGANREIISTDNNLANTSRGFQFRVNTSGQLEFNFVGVATAAVTVAIPTTGPHAFAANQWFHAAYVSDGTNGTFYWTRVDPSFTAANALITLTADAVDPTDAAILVLGNEGRATGGSGEVLSGFLDEVRISTVARASTEFIFQPVPEPGTTGTLLLAAAGLAFRRRRS